MKPTTSQGEAEQVIFRAERRRNGEVFALFPNIPASRGLVTSYQHIGQHGAADYAHCMATSRPAKPQEFAELKTELESRGYVLDVRRRRQARGRTDAN